MNKFGNYSHAASRPKGEGLAGLLLVPSVGLIRPSLGDKLVRSDVVGWRVSGCPGVHGNCRAAWDELFGDIVTTLGDRTSQTRWHGRKDAQTFVDAGIHVGKLLQLEESHGLGVFEVRSDFLGEFLVCA
jgi:hypothetical protein